MLTAVRPYLIYPAWYTCSGNDAALADLLSAEAPELENTWRQTWDLEEGSVTLDAAVAEGNPLLAAMLALHKESCKLLYASGGLLQFGALTDVPLNCGSALKRLPCRRRYTKSITSDRSGS